MAPALAEPISPTEKLSNSTASTTASTVTHTHSTRSTRKSESAALISSASKEKPNNKRTAAAAAGASVTNTPTITSSATTSTRVTRSKDAYQRVFEQAIGATAAAAAEEAGGIENQNSKSSTSPLNKKPKTEYKSSGNETPMGLSNTNSIALNNNNNNNNNKLNNKTKSLADKEPVNQKSATATTTASSESPNDSCNSTEQLLADLTSDFEETITAEICLRQQLLEAPLGKTKAAANKHSISTETAEEKDILVIKSAAAEESSKEILPTAAAAVADKKSNKNKLMDSDDTAKTENEMCKNENAVEVSKAAAEELKEQESTTENAKTNLKAEGERSVNDAEDDVLGCNDVFMQESKENSPSCSQQNDNRSQNLRVQELPPVSTDSTMTASEVEDNLEGKLKRFMIY